MVGKPKLPTRRVAADDCTVTLGRVLKDGQIVEKGTPYPVHEGEWVEVMPYLSVGEMLSLQKLRDKSFNSDQEGNAALAAMQSLCASLAGQITDWNWTDMQGNPLPKPSEDPAVLERLSADELAWLISAIMSGESVAERKNGLAPSATSS